MVPNTHGLKLWRPWPRTCRFALVPDDLNPFHCNRFPCGGLWSRPDRVACLHLKAPAKPWPPASPNASASLKEF